MLQTDSVRALIDSGRVDEAVALVERGAQAGDAASLYQLADWRLFGLYGPQDFAAAHAALAGAAGAGHDAAGRALAYLIAAGIGCPPDFPSAMALLRAQGDAESMQQLALLSRAPGVDHAVSAPRSILAEAPLMVRIDGFATAEECDYLMARCGAALQPALIVDPLTGEGRPDPVRRSDAMSVLAMDEDLVIHHLNRRIAAATGTSTRQGEPLNILRYRPGQEFRRHHDAYAGVARADQRILTVLIWLNDGYDGGETLFTELGFAVAGRKGDALIFRNTLDDGRRDERGWHAGTPVVTGEKWLASRWIRAGIYTPE